MKTEFVLDYYSIGLEGTVSRRYDSEQDLRADLTATAAKYPNFPKQVERITQVRTETTDVTRRYFPNG